MNKNFRSGGIKFRELDYSKNSSHSNSINKNQIRSKEDVLKLFTASGDISKKENKVSEISPQDDDTSTHLVKPKIENSEKHISNNENKPFKPNVNKPLKPNLDIVNERSDVQSCVIDTTVEQNSCKKIYSVMIGKISTRKHKQWESDGFLEITGKNAVLKDTKGKILSRTTVKPELIEDGFRLCLGGKEIEIVELASENVILENQNSQESKINDSLSGPPLKKQKIFKNFTPVKSGNSLHFNNYEPLIMPHPPLDIEWSHENDEQKIHEVSVDGCLASVLRPHQREGVIFLYKCIMGMNNFNFKGAILADEMGLGKTLQCISLVWTLLKQGPYGKPVLKRVLIVAPSSLCGNWNKEFKRWLGTIKIAPYVVEGKQKVKDFTKTPRANVMIISYDSFIRNVDNINNLKFDLIICDEGHRLKNSEVKTLKGLDKLDCKRRILLTGTPVQNDLQEFYTLANFVNPGILGTFNEYKTYYEQAIVKSYSTSVEEDDVILGQERARELHDRSKTFILRRTNYLINQYLPQKHEVVIFCRPTSEQNNLYSLITDYWFNRSVMGENVLPLAIITALKKVCNHPYLFTCEKSAVLDDILPRISSKLSLLNCSYSFSSKFIIVQTIFQSLKKTQEKLVLVSYFTQTLNLLEKLCSTEGLVFCRLDGNTPVASRSKIVDRFNSKDNSTCRIFLLSAKAGGVGLNLVGASRLILFDSDWNPANDAQAMARIWRDGQKRSVYIYRLLLTGTIEEKIYQRQISKTGLSEAVVDANSSASLKLSNNELKDLFTLDNNTFSVTHDLMECSCTGLGDTPEKKETTNSDDESRDCQFELKKKEPQQQITINQLLYWEHYKQPINEALMKELMVNQVEKYITFIFKNSAVQYNKIIDQP